MKSSNVVGGWKKIFQEEEKRSLGGGDLQENDGAGMRTQRN